MLHLRSLTGFQYTLSVGILLYLVYQISSERKVKNKFRHLSLSTFKVLQGTSLQRQIKTSHGRHFRRSPGRQIRASPGRQIETFPGRSNRIFRGRPGDVGGGRPRDVLGTNICWLCRQHGSYCYFCALRTSLIKLESTQCFQLARQLQPIEHIPSIYLASQLIFSLKQNLLDKIKQFKKLDRPSKKFPNFPFPISQIAG